jgi:translation initiation factor IF-1
VELIDYFDNFVEYMFRILGKGIIECTGNECPDLEELKKMNVMIAEIHEKMWTEKYRLRRGDMVYSKTNDYKLIELLDKYDIYYIYGHNGDSEIDLMFKKSMEEKINEYRGIEENNNK